MLFVIQLTFKSVVIWMTFSERIFLENKFQETWQVKARLYKDGFEGNDSVMSVCHCQLDSVELEDGTERGWGAWSMGGLLQYWNLSGRHQLFGLQSPSQGCSVGSGISSSDRSISNCIYCGYSICNVQVSQKEKRSWGVSDLLTSCPSLALVIDLTNTYRLYYFLLPAVM